MIKEMYNCYNHKMLDLKSRKAKKRVEDKTGAKKGIKGNPAMSTVDINVTVSIIPLSTSGLNVPITRRGH
jgi:hypothetical protein